MAGLALTVALGVGVIVGGASQMAAVDAGDPRTGVVTTITASPSPSPMLTSSPSPTEDTTPTTSAEPTAGQVWLYTLAEGDSLSRLAIRFGTTTEELLILNPEYADNEDLVEIGSVMIMPCTPLAQVEDRC